MEWDAVVIGAGPAGCFTAMQIAFSGFKVLVIEEHHEVGLPIQCSGLISPRAVELAGTDKSVILNTLSGMRVISPLGTDLKVNSGRVLALAIDRAVFDQELAEKAQNAGAVLLKGVKAKAVERIAGGFRLTAEGENQTNLKIDTKLLIGADGARSQVAAWLGLKQESPRAVMFAADLQLHNPDTDIMSIFLGQNLAPGWFGWIIPLDSDTCRVGTGYAFEQHAYSPRHYFRQLVEHYPQIFKDHKILRYTGGWVPLGLMPKIYVSHAMLVGDAACQTKPLSGGGIYMGLRGAKLCGKIAAEALSGEDYSEENLSRYQIFWENEMKEEISSAMKLRESYLHFKDEDIDRVLRFLNKPKYQELISHYGDIDYPSRTAQKLLGFSPWINRLFLTALKLADNTNLI